MAFNGAGVFDIDTAGQPVVAGTTIDATVFNDLTADLASGLSTCITKDGQTTVTANIPFAGYRLTGIGYGTSSTDAARVDNANVLNMCEGRLTLTTGVPVTTTDVTAAETIYFAPYRGNRIALYDGSNWYMRTFTELSVDVPDVTGMHDVFCYDNSGTPALEVLAWTNDTTRATALTTQNGVLVKTGATTRRYLGTFYCTTAGNGQTEDSVANRYLWNYYNRVARPMRVLGSGSWSYTTATWRQANGSSTNQLNFVVGVSEEPVSAQVSVSARNTTNVAVVGASIALDSTSVPAATARTAFGSGHATAAFSPMTAQYSTFVAVGKHYLAWLEASEAAGTTTWFGSSSLAGETVYGGIAGEIRG